MQPSLSSMLERETESPSAAPRVDFRGRRLVCTFAWPHDPFYRPLVGAFADRRLIALAPSVRRREKETKPWPLVATLELPEDAPSGPELSLACIETGEMLWSGRARTAEPGEKQELSVLDLMRLGFERRKPFPLAGFPIFLRLPLFDQVHILCLDLLGVTPDVRRVERHVGQLLDGKLSILDLRDRIVRSKEFAKRRPHISLDDRLGRWCLWRGLDIVSPRLMRGPLMETIENIPDGAVDANVQHAESPRPHLAETLSRIALGRAPDRLRDAWIEAHDADIGRFRTAIAHDRPTDRQPSKDGSDAYKIRLLSAMRVDAAGSLLPNGRVRSNRGVEDYVLYGPYMRLVPGRYAVTFEIAASAKPASGMRLILDAVYQDALLAHLDLSEPYSGTRAHRLEFTVTRAAYALMRKAMVEFRVWTNGVAEVEIESVAIEAARDESAERSAPSVQNWLSLLTPGAVGVRVEGGAIRAEGTPGCVFFGPYRYLLPGGYLFSLDCEAAPPDGGTESVVLEIVTTRDAILAKREFALAQGDNRIVVGFVVPTCSDFASLAGPLEFRLIKRGVGEILCKAARLLAANPSDKEFGDA